MKVVELDGLPDKGDVSDWLDSGHTMTELQSRIDKAPQWKEAQAPASSERKICLVDDEELMSIEDPPWLNHGRIPGNANVMIFGPPATLKSFVALDLASAVALGLEWHGQPVARGNVVYIVAEGVVGMKHRVQAWKKFHGVQGKLGVYFLKHGIGLKVGSSEVNELLAEIRAKVTPPPVLIVVDTLARNLVGNENATEDMNNYVRACDQLREATGATVLSIHHTGYGDSERARGSSANTGAVDTEILATRDGYRVSLKCKKQKDAAEFGDISFEAVPVGKSLVLNPMDQMGGKLDGNRLVCLQAVHQAEGGLTHGQWRTAAGLDKKNSSFNSAIKWLEGTGYVKRVADKKYTITESGRMALGPQSRSSPSLVHPPQVSGSPSRGGLEDPTMDQTLGLTTVTEAA